MKSVFVYRFDKFSRRFTWAVAIVVILVTGWFTWQFFNVGAYLPAWFLTMAISVAALYVLSIPRTICVKATALEIHCVLELTTIDMGDIVSVNEMPNRGTGLWLLLGSYGFFGYYGYYLDWKRWEVVKMYASQWDNLVEITDIYEQRYVVSCQNRESLLKAIAQARAALPNRA